MRTPLLEEWVLVGSSRKTPADVLQHFRTTPFEERVLISPVAAKTKPSEAVHVELALETGELAVAVICCKHLLFKHLLVVDSKRGSCA